MMQRLLVHYEARGPRKVIKVNGTPVPLGLQNELPEELKQWRARHFTNTRPSINAKSYMILRSPVEFEQKNSNNAKAAAKKFLQYSKLWQLAKTALS